MLTSHIDAQLIADLKHDPATEQKLDPEQRKPAPQMGGAVASGPLAGLGQLVLAAIAEFGSLFLLVIHAAWAVVASRDPDRPLGEAMAKQMVGFFGVGIPLVLLANLGMGSFLAMQAFFGATFVEATGPVVGIGLIRNVSPLMMGLVTAGLVVAQIVPELRLTPYRDLDLASGWQIDREVLTGRQDRREPEAQVGRIVAARWLAAMIAGPVLCLLGSISGTTSGYLVARYVFAINEAQFFGMLWEMLWVRDVLGMIVKGAAFGSVAAILACREGLRESWPNSELPDSERTPAAMIAKLRWPIARTVLLIMAVDLMINSSWFMLMYLAGPPFGPTVLPPAHP